MINYRLRNVLRTCENCVYWIFLIANVIFIIGNPIYCYVEHHSGWGVFFSLLGTMLVAYNELAFLNWMQDLSEVEHVAPNVGTVFHLIWRTVWLIALVAFNEIVLLVAISTPF